VTPVLGVHKERPPQLQWRSRKSRFVSMYT